MMGSARAKRKSVGALWLISCLSAGVLFPAQSALAFWSGITIGSTSSESVSFGIYTTGTSSGSIVWSGPGNTGMLLDTGFNGSNGNANVPTLSAPLGGLNPNPQTNSQSGLGTISNLGFSLGTAPFSPSPLNSTNFGTAGVVVSAGTNVIGDNLNTPPHPILPQHVGVAFDSGTSLASSSSIAAGTAAVSYTALHADFANGASALNGVSAGAAISATGTLSTHLGSFVELADTGSVIITNGTNVTTIPFFLIAGEVWNGSSATPFQQGAGSIGFVGSGTTFTINYSDILSSLTMPASASISVSSQLTLVADPDSSIQLGELTGPLPNLGVYGGYVVPEPSAWIQLGTAMVLLIGLWGGSRYRRISLNMPRLRGVPLLLLAGLTSLILGLGAPGTVEAGTVTINGLSSPLSVSSSGFSSFSSSTDSVNQTLDFDGTYLSTGGFPAPGQSSTYWVVFQEPDGTQTEATELTVTGLSPTTTGNTSVDLFFQGLVTTPIGPGPGVFFIPEPGGYFDVAAYLRDQQSANVPTDLSVLVQAAAVPEPSSLALCGVAALISLGVALRHRSGVRSAGRLLLDRSRLHKK